MLTKGQVRVQPLPPAQREDSLRGRGRTTKTLPIRKQPCCFLSSKVVVCSDVVADVQSKWNQVANELSSWLVVSNELRTDALRSK